jgi:nitroreductase
VDAIDALKGRRSVRSYEDKPVPREVLEEIIDAARLAPTANNTQPWEFIVVTERDMRAKVADLTDYGKFIAQSSACVVVFARDVERYIEDGSAATENILIAAHALGLGACWVAGYKKAYEDPLREILGVPTGYKLVSLVAVGYPVGKTGPHGKRPLSDVLHWEKF